MVQKASIYSEKDVLNDTMLLDQLKAAIVELEEKMKASLPIMKGGRRIGYGVSKAQRGIAADSVISIAKAIKSLKGW